VRGRPPGGPPGRAGGTAVELRRWCDEVVYLLSPEGFTSISQFYQDFEQVEDEQVVDLLRPDVPDFGPPAWTMAHLRFPGRALGKPGTRQQT
jgi:hypothetical protein